MRCENCKKVKNVFGTPDQELLLQVFDYARALGLEFRVVTLRHTMGGLNSTDHSGSYGKFDVFSIRVFGFQAKHHACRGIGPGGCLAPRYHTGSIIPNYTGNLKLEYSQWNSPFLCQYYVTAALRKTWCAVNTPCQGSVFSHSWR